VSSDEKQEVDGEDFDENQDPEWNCNDLQCYSFRFRFILGDGINQKGVGRLKRDIQYTKSERNREGVRKDKKMMQEDFEEVLFVI